MFEMMNDRKRKKKTFIKSRNKEVFMHANPFELFQCEHGEVAASCCAVEAHHPSLSRAEQVKVMNLIQVPDKRLLFKATVPLIFRCAY